VASASTRSGVSINQKKNGKTLMRVWKEEASFQTRISVF
jgi:hypothetical protein